jgi:hypothetical protein
MGQSMSYGRSVGVDVNRDGFSDFNLKAGQTAAIDFNRDGKVDEYFTNPGTMRSMGPSMPMSMPMSMPISQPMPMPVQQPMPMPSMPMSMPVAPAPMPVMPAPAPMPMPVQQPAQSQWISNVARPQMTMAANPPVTSGNIQYGPSYSMQYQKRSTADKTAVKYTGFLPLEGVYEEDTCRIG